MFSPTALAVLTIILVQGNAPAIAWTAAQTLNSPSPERARPQPRPQAKRSTTFRPVPGRLPGGRRPGGSR